MLVSIEWIGQFRVTCVRAESNHRTETMFEGTLARSASKAQSPTISWKGWRSQPWDFRCRVGKEASNTSMQDYQDSDVGENLHPMRPVSLCFLCFLRNWWGYRHTSGIGCPQAQAPKEAVAATTTCFLLFFDVLFQILKLWTSIALLISCICM